MNRRAVYFFLIPDGVSRDNYAHNALVLAEGLQQLGWEIYANIDYWHNGPDDQTFLFRHDPAVYPSDCVINVLTYDWMHFINVIPYELQENRKSIRVYLEDAGWLKTPGLSDDFRVFDLVLKSHFNRRCKYPSNYQSWSFGLTNRIIQEVDNAKPVEKRLKRILVNFGVTHTHRHQLRDLCEQKLYPELAGIFDLDRTKDQYTSPPDDNYHRFMWNQTAGRHYPEYYERLAQTSACACFGGSLAPPKPDDWSSLWGYGMRVSIRKKFYQYLALFSASPYRCAQWESWRFWETLAAGCAALMVDFEKYGIQLPVQPANWVHYIGFDLDDLDTDINRLKNEPDLLLNIGSQGRQWALEHYSPMPTALRFLEKLHLQI